MISLYGGHLQQLPHQWKEVESIPFHTRLFQPPFMYITKPGFPVQGQMSHNHHWTSCTPVMGGQASGVSEPLCVEPAAAQLWDPQPHWMVGCRGSSSTDGREAVRTSLLACHLFTPLPGSQNFPWPLSAQLETFLHWSSQEARWGSSLGPRTDGLWSPPHFHWLWGSDKMLGLSDLYLCDLRRGEDGQVG